MVAIQIVIDSIAILNTLLQITFIPLSISKQIYPLSFKFIVLPVPQIYVIVGIKVDTFTFLQICAFQNLTFVPTPILVTFLLDPCPVAFLVKIELFFLELLYDFFLFLQHYSSLIFKL